MLLDEIKRRYPEPTTASKGWSDRHADQDTYCVGGAACLFFNQASEPFPPPETLSLRLRGINSSLPKDIADDLAYAITNANDAADFAVAWQRLGEALEYGKGKAC